MTTRQTRDLRLLSATLLLGGLLAASVTHAAERDELPGQGWCRPISQAGALLTTDQAVLTWQGDGNLVLYKRALCGDPAGATGCGPGAALWASGTNGRADRLCFQGDGNLVAYGPSGAVWATHTEGTAFRTANGHYLRAVNGGGEDLRADAGAVGTHEKFYVEPQGGGMVALRTRISVSPGGVPDPPRAAKLIHPGGGQADPPRAGKLILRGRPS